MDNPNLVIPYTTKFRLLLSFDIHVYLSSRSRQEATVSKKGICWWISSSEVLEDLRPCEDTVSIFYIL